MSGDHGWRYACLATARTRRITCGSMVGIKGRRGAKATWSSNLAVVLMVLLITCVLTLSRLSCTLCSVQYPSVMMLGRLSHTDGVPQMLSGK